jgi:hypothetical protein
MYALTSWAAPTRLGCPGIPLKANATYKPAFKLMNHSLSVQMLLKIFEASLGPVQEINGKK